MFLQVWLKLTQWFWRRWFFKFRQLWRVKCCFIRIFKNKKREREWEEREYIYQEGTADNLDSCGHFYQSSNSLFQGASRILHLPRAPNRVLPWTHLGPRWSQDPRQANTGSPLYHKFLVMCLMYNHECSINHYKI